MRLSADDLFGLGIIGLTGASIWYFWKNPSEFNKVYDYGKSVIDGIGGNFDSLFKNLFPVPTTPPTTTPTTPTPTVPTGTALDNVGVTKIFPTVNGKETYTVIDSHNPGRREWEIKANGFVNVEAGAYIDNFKGSDYIAVKIRGGPHSTSNPKYGCSIGGRFPIPYNSKNNGEVECPHPVYDFFTLPPKFAYTFNGKSIGVKTILIGSYMWLYVDTDGLVGGRPANKWRLWAEGDIAKLAQQKYIDQLGSNPFGKAPIYGTEHSIHFRMDVPSADISHASVREVALPVNNNYLQGQSSLYLNLIKQRRKPSVYNYEWEESEYY